jgi:hypothetical protein
MSGEGFTGSEQIWEQPRQAATGSPAVMAPGKVMGTVAGDWQVQPEPPAGVPGVAYSVPPMPMQVQDLPQVQGVLPRVPASGSELSSGWARLLCESGARAAKIALNMSQM